MEKREVGKVTRYFAKIGVAAVKLSATLRVGDTISIEGAHTALEQKVDSIQVEKQALQEAGPGTEVGLKVKDRVREKDVVYKVES
jgi:putative protease